MGKGTPGTPQPNADSDPETGRTKKQRVEEERVVEPEPDIDGEAWDEGAEEEEVEEDQEEEVAAEEHAATLARVPPKLRPFVKAPPKGIKRLKSRRLKARMTKVKVEQVGC